MIKKREGIFLSFVVFLQEDFSNFDGLKICLKSLVTACCLKSNINIVIFSFKTDSEIITNFLNQQFNLKQRKKILFYCVNQKLTFENRVIEYVVRKLNILNPTYLKIIDPCDWLQISEFNHFLDTINLINVDVYFHNYIRIVNSSPNGVYLNKFFESNPQVRYTFPKIPVNFICCETMIFKFSIFKKQLKTLPIWLDNIFLNYQLSLFIFLLAKNFFFINQIFVYHYPHQRLIKPNKKNMLFFSIFIQKLTETNVLEFNIDQKIIFANYFKQIFLIFLKNFKVFKDSFPSKQETLEYNINLINKIKNVDKLTFRKISKNLVIKIFIFTSGKINLASFFKK